MRARVTGSTAALSEDTSVCEYSINGKPSSAARDHGIATAGAMNGQTPDPAAQKMMQGFGSAVPGGQDSDAKNFRHAGEVAALVIAIQSGDASQMNLTRQSLICGHIESKNQCRKNACDEVGGEEDRDPAKPVARE